MKSLPLFVALLAAGSASAAQVWVAPAAQKIRPSAQPPAGATAAAKIAAAKNEFEAFQVVVTGQADSVSMSLDALRDSAGHTISGRDVVLEYTNVPGTSSKTDFARIQSHTGSVILFHHKTDPTSRGVGLSHSVNGSHDIRPGGGDYTVVGSLQVTAQSVKSRIAGPAFHSPD